MLIIEATLQRLIRLNFSKLSLKLVLEIQSWNYFLFFSRSAVLKVRSRLVCSPSVPHLSGSRWCPLGSSSWVQGGGRGSFGCRGMAGGGCGSVRPLVFPCVPRGMSYQIAAICVFMCRKV